MIPFDHRPPEVKSYNIQDKYKYNFSNSPLKPDHENRPVWVCDNLTLFLETYSPIYKQAYDFLIAISDPVSRPHFIHEYTITQYSLYAAASLGLSTEDILFGLDRMSKNTIPHSVSSFITRHTEKCGKVKLILKNKRYYIESPYVNVLDTLLQMSPVIRLARCDVNRSKMVQQDEHQRIRDLQQVQGKAKQKRRRGGRRGAAGRKQKRKSKRSTGGPAVRVNKFGYEDDGDSDDDDDGNDFLDSDSEGGHRGMYDDDDDDDDDDDYDDDDSSYEDEFDPRNYQGQPDEANIDDANSNAQDALKKTGNTRVALRTEEDDLDDLNVVHDQATGYIIETYDLSENTIYLQGTGEIDKSGQRQLNRIDQKYAMGFYDAATDGLGGAGDGDDDHSRTTAVNKLSHNMFNLSSIIQQNYPDVDWVKVQQLVDQYDLTNEEDSAEHDADQQYITSIAKYGTNKSKDDRKSDGDDSDTHGEGNDDNSDSDDDSSSDESDDDDDDDDDDMDDDTLKDPYQCMKRECKTLKKQLKQARMLTRRNIPLPKLTSEALKARQERQKKLLQQQKQLQNATGEGSIESQRLALKDNPLLQTTIVYSFEIRPDMVEDVRAASNNLGYPMLEEYDFRHDGVSDEYKLPIELRQEAQIREYQEKALSKMFGSGRARSGIIVLPCGAGKTLVGITAMTTIGRSCLIFCSTSVAVEQWQRQVHLWTNLPPEYVYTFTSNSKSVFKTKPKVLITTYSMIAVDERIRSEATSAIINEIKQQEWGLLLLDEVHVAPADKFKQSITLTHTRCKLGLTATLVREDDRVNSLIQMIGPKLYEASWLDLSRQGFIATVRCYEVWCPMTVEFYKTYLTSPHHRRVALGVANPVKYMCLEMLLRLHESRGDKIMVFCDHTFTLSLFAIKLERPFLHGGTGHQERMEVLKRFSQAPHGSTVFISKIGDNSIDLPDTNVLIQISAHYASRRQEAQRLGRILRPKSQKTRGHVDAHFYSLISQDTEEVGYASKRQRFLVDQGYSYKVLQFDELKESILPQLGSKPLGFSRTEEQLQLLHEMVSAGDDSVYQRKEREAASQKRAMGRDDDDYDDDDAYEPDPDDGKKRPRGKRLKT